jgi:hypothetical protein
LKRVRALTACGWLAGHQHHASRRHWERARDGDLGLAFQDVRNRVERRGCSLGA